MSVDALRGFDMFMIVAADDFARAFKKVNTSSVAQFLGQQFTHKAWEGFAFYDLIFPLFAFLVGVSIVFSLGKATDRGGKAAAYGRVFRRFILLFLLGLFYYGGFANVWPKIRLLGVLQRLALCYLGASLIFLNFKPKGMVAICAGLLLGYWALMAWVPVPGVGAGCYAPGKNLANYIDSRFLPGRLNDGTWDPEGLLSTLPAIGTSLLGVFTGMLLIDRSVSTFKKSFYLILGGIGCAAVGWLWNIEFPVIKKIWTSSYVLVAGGYSCILLGLFCLIIDVLKLRRWAVPFVWIGVNPLAIYLLNSLVDFGKIAERFVGGNIKLKLGIYGETVEVIVTALLIILLARFLYNRKIFLRV